MTPPAPRLARARVRLCLAVFLAATSLALVACASTAAIPPAAPVSNPSPAWQEGEPSAGPTPTEEPLPADLAPYISRIPKFGRAPTPVPVALPHVAGQSAFAYEIPTTQPVAFLTIDDGAIRHPLALDLMRYAKIPVTLFLTTNYVAGHQDYFAALRDTGYAVIENHTISHPSLPPLGRAGARSQLCGANDNLAQWFGRRPVLFRPPFGNYDYTTLQAAADCGLQAGFYWRETVDAGNVYYQRPDHKIHAGDIILMHFRVAFPDDFIAALTAIKNSGLTPALLEDYVTSAPPVTLPPPAP